MDLHSMDYRAISAQGPALTQVNADALVMVLAPELTRSGDATLDRLVDEAVKSGDFAFKAGKTLYVHRPAGVKAARLVLTVAGSAQAKDLKATAGKALTALKDLGAAHTALAVAKGLALTAAHAQAVVQAVADATYVFRHTKPSASKAGALKKMTLLCADAELTAVKQGLARGEALAKGVNLARELGNLPANYCTPSHLAHEARQLAKTHKHIKVEVLERPALEKLKMGSFLSVTNGSAQPPKFIVLRYQGAAASQAPLVLVGKGITFDTGGISLKPGAGMDEMKYDMGGAASVLGTFRTIAELQPKVNLVGLIPTCENMPSGTATKPGDVVTSMSGQTIEVLNTDAEGRLILCDALTYAERFKPAAVVDIATLTGACVIALGNLHSGLFSADDELAQALLKAGQEALDTAWRMPLDEEYGESLKSNFADLGNVGGREGGAITAAVFLSKFTKAYRWAHLDIAGSAWKSGAAKGGTGRPVGLLTQFILNQASAGAGAIQALPAKPSKAVTPARRPAAKKAAAKPVRKAAQV
jgi:leucyl aminopeptidase